MAAADFRVAERGALLGPAVHLDNGRVQVDRQRGCKVGWAGAARPQPGQQLAADRVELPHVGPLVRPQPRPDRRRRPRAVEQLAGRAGAQDGDVVDAVPTSQHRPDHRQRLGAAVHTVPGQAQALVDQPGQVEPLRQHRCRQQPRVRHQIRLIEAHRHPAQLVVCSHLSGALSAWSDQSVARPIVSAQGASARLRHAANDQPQPWIRVYGGRLQRCVQRVEPDESDLAQEVDVPGLPRLQRAGPPERRVDRWSSGVSAVHVLVCDPQVMSARPEQCRRGWSRPCSRPATTLRRRACACSPSDLVSPRAR